MATYTDKSDPSGPKSYSNFRDLERAVRSRSTSSRTETEAGTGNQSATGASPSSNRSSDRDQENRDIQSQRSSPTAARERAAAADRARRETEQGAAGQTPDQQKSVRVNAIIEGYRNGTITGAAGVDELITLGWQPDNARRLLGIVTTDVEGDGNTNLELDVWKASQNEYGLNADASAQIDWIIKQHLAKPDKFTESDAYDAIAKVLGDDPTRVGTPGYQPIPFLVRQKIFNDALASAKTAGGDPLTTNNSATASSAASANPFFKPLFKEFDLSNMPNSEMRPLKDAAFGAVNDQFNLNGLAPGFADVLRGRAQSAVPQFELGAALGQFGQPGITKDQVQLGGKGVQGLMGNAALQNLGGGPTSNSFQNFMQQAQNGLGTSGGQAASILEALGVTGSESARDAYSGIASNFINPRLAMLPQGLRSMFGAGMSAEIEQMLGGKASSEINPAEYMQQLQNKGMFF